MAKKFRRIFAIAMVMCMFVSVLPMQALAADDEDNLTTYVHPTETQYTYDENGVPTVVVQITKADTTGTTADGADLVRTETTIDTTTYHSDGSVQTVNAVEGTETKTYTDVPVQPGQEVPEIELKLENGTVEKTTTDTYKDPALSIPSEGEYDLSRTETTVTREYEATVDNFDKNLVIGSQKTELYSPVAPESYEGKQYCDILDCSYCDPSDTQKYHTHSFEGLFETSKDQYINATYRGDVIVAPKPESEGIDQGYDFIWTGAGDATYGSIPVFAEEIVWLEKVYKEIVYLTDENGDPVTDANGDPVIDEEKSVIDPLKSVVDMEKTTFVSADSNRKAEYDPVTGYKATGMVNSPGQFALMNEYGQYFYAYCMDAATGTSPEFNAWYQLRNMEDAIESEDNPYGYISEDEAAMIRAIALNGYWGSDPNVYETDEEGNLIYEAVLDENGNPVMQTQYVYEYDEEGKLVYYTNAAGLELIKRTKVEVPVTRPVAKKDADGNIVTDPTAQGSIESLKQLMRDNYNADSEVIVRYPGSNEEHKVKFYELIDGLTEAEALAVTQAAIWAFANANDPGSGTVVGVLSASKYHNTKTPESTSFLNQYRPLKDEESDARMQALYELFLTKLDPVYENSELNSATKILPNGEAISDVALVIKDKAEGVEANDDDNADNDVYNTELNFTLAFVPDQNSDDMLVYLFNGTELMVDSEGKPVVRRLAGNNADDGPQYENVEYKDGVYTLTGLQLGENNEYVFNLKLEGTQHLDKGVYIYQAHGGGRDASQTLVGMVEGDQYVQATSTMTLSFEVTEECEVVVERAWRTEADPIIYPADTPAIYRLNAGNVEEIAEEEIPLAAPVVTGSNSFVIWLTVVMAAMFGLAVLNLSIKRRPRGKHEAI